MLTALILGLLALGTFTAIAIAVWTLAALANWVFGLFEDKDPTIDGNVTIGDPAILTEVEIGIKKKNPKLAEKFHDAINGTGNPKVTFWQAGKKVTEVNILKAKDASVDEVQGITRFERGGVIKQY